MGFIGDAVWTAADSAWGWGATYDKMLPVVDAAVGDFTLTVDPNSK